MAITAEAFRDLILYLADHPEARVEFERALRGDQLPSLPEIIRELADAQRRTEIRLDQLAARVEELTQAQSRTEARIRDLADAQKRTEESLAQLIRRVEALGEDTAWLKRDMGDVKGELLELKYIERAPSYLARLVRKGRVVPRSVWLEQIHDAEEKGVYTEDEALELSLLDLLAQGRRREDGAEAYLPVEVSWTIHDDDIERAARRADLLRRKYPFVIPVAAGQGFSPDTFVKARELQVTLIVGGQPIKPK